MPRSAPLIFCLLLLCYFLASLQLAHSSDPHYVCLSQLPKRVESLISRVPRGSFGILLSGKLRGQSDAKTLFELNSQKYFTPASNTKVLTTAAAFLRFGPEATWQTQFFSRIAENSTTGQLELCIKPQGFPSLQYGQLKSVAKALGRGYGRVALDVSYFGGMAELSNGAFLPDDTWGLGDIQWAYGAQPASVVINENTVVAQISPGVRAGDALRVKLLSGSTGGHADSEEKVPLDPYSDGGIQCLPEICKTLPADSSASDEFLDVFHPLTGGNSLSLRGQLRVGAPSQSMTLTILRPEQYLIDVMKYYMNSSQISQKRTRGSLSFDLCDSTKEKGWKQSSLIVSEPLTKLMNWTLQISDNLYAEMFMKQLAVAADTRYGNIRETGVAEVKRLLTQVLGVQSDTFQQHDGSGLSRFNLISPQALVQILSGIKYRTSSAAYKLYRSMLPLAGVSGSLQYRFVNYPSIASAKTGSMTGVSSLSGYVRNELGFDDDTLIFSVMMDHFSDSLKTMRDIQDELVLSFAFTDPSC